MFEVFWSGFGVVLRDHVVGMLLADLNHGLVTVDFIKQNNNETSFFSYDLM